MLINVLIDEKSPHLTMLMLSVVGLAVSTIGRDEDA